MRIIQADDIRQLPSGKLQIVRKKQPGEKRRCEFHMFTLDEAIEAARKLLEAKIDLNVPATETQAEAMAISINMLGSDQFSEAFAL
jgi:hypothetical protein